MTKADERKSKEMIKEESWKLCINMIEVRITKEHEENHK